MLAKVTLKFLKQFIDIFGNCFWYRYRLPCSCCYVRSPSFSYSKIYHFLNPVLSFIAIKVDMYSSTVVTCTILWSYSLMILTCCNFPSNSELPGNSLCCMSWLHPEIWYILSLNCSYVHNCYCWKLSTAW